MKGPWAIPNDPRIPEHSDADPPPAPRCPTCDRVMSNREAIEQGACNDCNGGAWDPTGRNE